MLALEDNKLNSILPQIYVQGYQKIYADYLGIVDQLNISNTKTLDIPKQIIHPLQQKDSLFFLALSIIGIIVSFAIYYIYKYIMYTF